LNADPMVQFGHWFQQALDSDYPDANAMVLATVSADGKPSSRTVLLKGLDDGFTFFTNYTSAKAQDIAQNAQVALLFPWLQFERQVRICGEIHKISPEASADYFHSRPLGSQLGAWASDQSQTIASRAALVKQFEDTTERFKDSSPTTPAHWGGYKVIPESIEFWQGRESRLHDRFMYSLVDQQWQISRLQP
ncbi:MAG: pyridoxamine 5'-phosphate oxidase, partial [Leucothrix sp.]